MMTPAHWMSETGQGRVLCKLCPRECHLKPGDRGFCFVRQNVDGRMVLDTYGKSTGFCIDPIEKKPLSHFLPGTPVLSFGTAGCNLGCKFCQNWDISKSREVARLSDRAMPADIAAAARNAGCRSVAYTYNDPVIWAEYAMDTASACRELGIRSVAVTAGYIGESAREDFFSTMDAANIDLKAFEEDFYFKLTGSHLRPVLDTIEYVCNETDTWVELTNLIIPGANDSVDELTRMCEWIHETVGPDVPIHFTAFHPDFKMRDRGRTEHATLVRAYDLAKQSGLHHVYVGNVHDVQRQSTFCSGCGSLLIERDWHQLGAYRLSGNACQNCGVMLPGLFEESPGNWGAKRQRVRIESTVPPLVTIGTTAESGRAETETDVHAGGTPDHRNSETSKGDSNMSATLNEIDDEQQATILRAAAAMLHAAVTGHPPSGQIGRLGALAELPVEGVFVTVKRGETLRGCCGRQGATMLLGEALAESAQRTANDPRLPPVSLDELPYLELSVSMLGPLQPIPGAGAERARAIEVGRHGLRIQLGQQGGLLLPQVAVEQGWTTRQFLDGVCRKAGLPAGSWQADQAQLMRFDGVCFAMPFPVDVADPPSVRETRVIPETDMRGYHDWVAQNLQAMLTGATPMYYANGVNDGEVLGIVLSVSHPDRGAQQWLQLSVKDAMPLQSTLYRITEQAGTWLGRGINAESVQFELSLLGECVHHGPIAAVSGERPDLRGIDVAGRAILVSDGRRWAVQWDGKRDIEGLLDEAVSMEAFRGGEQLYSMRCQSTGERVAVSIGPRGDAGHSVRPPAVAGTFYPATDAERERQVDQLLDGFEPVQKRSAFAVMVPHAGLRFSGRIAADVWRRITVPRRTLIIGPKHTSDGVDWAVAPHESWQLSPSVAFDGDVATARDLAAAVPGFELDAAAHAREHGIEVQLPLMHRLCPTSQLTAVAMNGGSLSHYRKAARALAAWMGDQDDPPLLVVSSDMNHFADETENRRRDRVALEALASGDGERLLRVCQQGDISMCGRVPAAIVLMVMEEMGLEIPAEEVGYATSADYGGDTRRVVGYAGVIWPRAGLGST